MVHVVRWETTSPFLRSREFLWQEGHTATQLPKRLLPKPRMLNVYADFCKETLCMLLLKGRKTDSDKFAGAEMTYAIEALMHDGRHFRQAHPLLWRQLCKGIRHYIATRTINSYVYQLHGALQQGLSA